MVFFLNMHQLYLEIFNYLFKIFYLFTVIQVLINYFIIINILQYNFYYFIYIYHDTIP